MAPDDVLLRWANYDWTIVLSPQVFEADDRGRAYRMRPDTRAVLARQPRASRTASPASSSCPTPPRSARRVAERGRGDHARVVPDDQLVGLPRPRARPDGAGPRSWSLGDSFMQGLFVPDDQTPPEYLRRLARGAWGVPVSVLNTGHIGYSPEQYYYTLVEYYDRFRPQFVVVSVCPNDFGDGRLRDARAAATGPRGNTGSTRSSSSAGPAGRPASSSPVPFESQLVGPAERGNLPRPGREPRRIGRLLLHRLFNDFTDEHLRLMPRGDPRGGGGRRRARSSTATSTTATSRPSASPSGAAWSPGGSRLLLDPQSLAARSSAAVPGSAASRR